MTQAIPSLPGQAHEVADRILIAWHLKLSIPFVQILQVVGADRLNLIVSFLACNAQTFVVPQFTFIGVCSLVVHWIDVMSYSYYCSCQSCFFLSCLCCQGNVDINPNHQSPCLGTALIREALSGSPGSWITSQWPHPLHFTCPLWLSFHAEAREGEINNCKYMLVTCLKRWWEWLDRCFGRLWHSGETTCWGMVWPLPEE